MSGFIKSLGNFPVVATDSQRIGEVVLLNTNVAPLGFISAQGSTIGKLGSGATYAADDYKELFVALWSLPGLSSSDSTQPYYISAAKGATADADWTAGRTIKIDESGLFARASGGNAGTVGAKQLDEFKSHTHIQDAHTHIIYTNLTTGTGLVGIQQSRQLVNTSTPVTSTSTTATNQNTGGVETRPVNVAKYVYIRYAQSTPTLLALPTSKQNSYNAVIATDNSITSKDSDWIASITHTDGQYVVVTKNLGLTVAPKISVSAVGTVAFFSTVTTILNGAATITILQRTNQGTYATANTSINLGIDKQSPDYTAPGVFVGNVAKNQVATLYANPATVASLAGNFVDLTWDGVLGDTSIVTMTAGSAQFTLPAGEYIIFSDGICYNTGQSYHSLYNLSTTTEIEISKVSHAAASVDAIIPLGGIFSKLTLTTSTNLKIRQYGSSASAVGFGSSGWIGKRAKLQITKLNGQ